MTSKHRFFASIFILFIGAGLLALSQPVLTSKQLVDGMLSATTNSNQIQATIKAWERFDGRKDLIHNEMDIKLQVKPRKVYVLSKTPPNEDVELLYVEGQKDNKVYVNAGRWIPNVKLSAWGGKLRKDQHHTMHENGFTYLGDIVQWAKEQAIEEGRFEEVFRNTGEEKFIGRLCYKLEINDPTFKYVIYTLKDETLYDLAVRKRICEYLVVEKNESIDDFDEGKAGQKIKIPTSYAKRTVLYIDKQYMLPIGQFMYDEVGLFEKYEFHNLKVNPGFKPAEFTEDWEGYRF